MLPVQSYLVRTSHHTVLIDSCVGNHKTNDFHPPWHMKDDDSYLTEMLYAGIALESIDYVLCTHMHSDHIGWNTRLKDGRWVPSFPNAKYVFARSELDYVVAENHASTRASYNESVLPVIEAGQAAMVETDYAIDDEVWARSLARSHAGPCRHPPVVEWRRGRHVRRRHAQPDPMRAPRVEFVGLRRSGPFGGDPARLPRALLRDRCTYPDGAFPVAFDRFH